MLLESDLNTGDAKRLEVVGAGEYWLAEVAKGEVLCSTDLEGNQAVDTLFLNVRTPHGRYSAMDTIREQGNLYLAAGTTLLSDEGNAMLAIVADTCGRHDTLGGACAGESNTVRYALEKKTMHSCRDSWLLALNTHREWGLSKRDIAHNVNFFMNVPVTPDGGLTFEDGISAPGKYVELQAKMDVLVLISNCPQLNNPCNGYNPTPIELAVWAASRGA